VQYYWQKGLKTRVKKQKQKQNKAKEGSKGCNVNFGLSGDKVYRCQVFLGKPNARLAPLKHWMADLKRYKVILHRIHEKLWL